MSSVHDEERLRLRVARKDFFWLPLTLISIGGGLALIDIAERVVFDGLTLITPFQIVLDGYHRVTALIGAIVEPWFEPAINWLSTCFDWKVHFQPHWRSVFVLCMVVVMGILRAYTNWGQWGRATLGCVLMSSGALGAAIVVGALPLAGAWWVQGLIAAVPVFMLLVTLGMFISISSLLGRADVSKLLAFVRTLTLITAVLCAALFGLAAVLSFIPPIARSAGMLTLAASVAAIAAALIFAGHPTVTGRAGVVMLGGFVAAGLILLSNWAVIALS